MRKTSFIFAGIMSAVIGTAYAVGENTVASKAYVDTKQVKIPVAGTNANTPGESVVTYTDTAGTIGERGIFDSDTGWDDENGTIVEGHEGDLMPAGEIVPAINNVFNMMDDLEGALNDMEGTAGTVVVRDNEGAPYAAADIYDGSTPYNAQNNADDLITAGAVQGQIDNLPSITTSKLVCANGPDCTLWTIQNQYVLEGAECRVDSDCGVCVVGRAVCGNGMCDCTVK